MITIQLFTRRRAILGVLCLLLLFLLGWHSTSLSVPSASKTGALHGGTNALIDDIYNSTLGFGDIFVVSLPSRTDRRDGMTLQAALSNLRINFIDGVLGQSVPDSAIPTSPGHGRMGDPSIGSWRGHMNAIQEIVKRNLSSALIMEDDADWDIRIKDQLRDFATATHALTQPLAGKSTYADPTYPEPRSKDAAIPTFDFHQLPRVASPTASPYGDNWDLLWLGHCGMYFPSAARGPDLPRGRVVWEDHTVPQHRYLWNLWQPDELQEQYPDHTRVVHHAQEPVCSVVYAVTQQAARQILYQLALKDVNAEYDIALRWFCEGREGRNSRRDGCLTMQPALFQHHRPAGPRTHESDISPHGDGGEWRDEPHTNVLRWSVRMNAEELMSGGTDFKDQWPDQ